MTIADVERCILAIHDYGTREGATRSSIMQQLEKDGFSTDTIRQALEKML